MADPIGPIPGDEMEILEKTLDAVAIRDTADHTGTTVDNHVVRFKTIVIENTLNQVATFQCQAVMEDTTASSIININSEWDVPASTIAYQTCDTFFPYMRLVAHCSTSPSSGALTATFVRYKGA